MTFDEWWEKHPYSYADNEEQLKESCKMAWKAAYEEGRKRETSSYMPTRDIEFLKKCTDIKIKEVKRTVFASDHIQVDFYNGDSWYHEFPSRELLIKFNQLSYNW